MLYEVITIGPDVVEEVPDVAGDVRLESAAHIVGVLHDPVLGEVSYNFV